MAVKVAFVLAVSTLLFVNMGPSQARAHEVLPAIADMTQDGDQLVFDVDMNLEGIVAGVNLSAFADTNEAPEAEAYDTLRAMEPDALAAAFTAIWPDVAQGISIRAGGADIAPELISVSVDEIGNAELPRPSKIQFVAALPANAQSVEFSWAEEFGAVVIRQMGVEAPYDGYLAAGESTPAIQLGGGDQLSAFGAFVYYIPVGFEHIIPLGLDHILFVLGLFFLSAQLRPLLIQVSAFTLAHTVTLALAALGYVSAPGSIVEPLIAASIVFVALENVLSKGVSKWRPVVVFVFGLLHGLGFASVLGEYGIPEGNFIAALLGFNLGVEFGQLAVILAAFLLVGYWFGKREWYRRVIAVPASIAIAAVGAFWFVERVFL